MRVPSMESLVHMLRSYESEILDEPRDVVSIAKMATELFMEDGEYLFDVMDAFYITFGFLIIPLPGKAAGIRTSRGIIQFGSCT
jgi:hypothetical protein